MRSVVILMLMLTSALWADADKVKGIAECQTLAVSDGGYGIKVLNGGLIGFLRAEVVEFSFLGTRSLGVVEIEETTHSNVIEYRDVETKGRSLQIQIKLSERLGQDRYRGVVRGNLNGTEIPPKDELTFGELSCRMSVK